MLVCHPLSLALVRRLLTGFQSSSDFSIPFLRIMAAPLWCWLSSRPEKSTVSPVVVVCLPDPVHLLSLTPRNVQLVSLHFCGYMSHTPTSLDQGRMRLRCDLPPALLSEWPVSFTCLYSSTGWNGHRITVSTEIKLWRRFFPASPVGNRTRIRPITSPSLYQQYPDP